MAFKPNYRQQRAERDRAKREKTAERLKQQQERARQRKTQQAAPFTGDEADGEDV